MARQDAIFQLVAMSGASVVCFQETKIRDIPYSVVRRSLGQDFDCFFFLPAAGTRGGILIAWKSSVVKISNPHRAPNSLTMQVSQNGQPGWWLTVVYGLQAQEGKLLFLQELRDIRDLHPGAHAWVVPGDFNLILDVADKSNDNINRRMMGWFRRVLGDLDLKELYLNGRRYTWSNKRDSPTMEKLDQVFASIDWEITYPSSLLSAMSSSVSDHCPLILNLAVEMKKGRRFHFESFWPKVEGFLDTV